VANVYEYIGRSIRKSNEVDADIGKISDELILPGGFDERINVHINGVRHVGQETDFPNSFILSNPRGNVLGTNVLGVTETKTTIKVYNGENTYYETFNNSDFVDTGSTTATTTYGNMIELGSGDEYYTTAVFLSKEDNCTAAKFILRTDDYNLDETTIWFKNDIDNDLEKYLLTNTDYLYFSDIGKTLYCKLLSTGSDNYIALDETKTLFRIQYLTEHQTFTFAESGEGTLFYDSTSSSDIIRDTDILNPTVYFDSGVAEYYSQAIPLRDSYNTVLLSVGSLDGNFLSYISNDGKDTWTLLPRDIETTLSFNSTDKAYIKFINNVSLDYSSVTFTSTTPVFPIIFPGAAVGSDTIIYRDDNGEQFRLVFNK